MAAPKTSERDILHLLRRYGWAMKLSDALITDYKTHRVVHQGKRPFDAWASIDGKAIAVEVKSSNTYSFPFVSLTANGTVHKYKDASAFARGEPEEWPEPLREIRNHGIQWHQRRGLTRFEELSGGQSWLALQLGGNAVNAKENPRRLFLIPWKRWIELEAKLLELHMLSASLKGTRIVVRENKLTVLDVFADCELEWQGGNTGWSLLPNHPFSQSYLGTNGHRPKQPLSPTQIALLNMQYRRGYLETAVTELRSLRAVSSKQYVPMLP